jgi:hypothetical protein
LIRFFSVSRLDQLDLLDRDRGLIRGRTREVDLGRPLGRDEAEELVVGDDRDGDAGRAPASRQRAELGEPDDRAGLLPARRRGAKRSSSEPPSSR